MNASNSTFSTESPTLGDSIRIVVSVMFSLIGDRCTGKCYCRLDCAFMNRNMRKTTNLLVVNLAASDLLFVTCFVPFTAVSYVLPVWPFGEAWCKINIYLTYVSVYSSVYTLVIISVYRYYGVTKALRSRTFPMKCTVLVAVTIMWVVILLSNVPLLFHSRVFKYTLNGENRAACVFLENLDNVDRQTFVFIFLAFGYLIPLLFLLVMYFFIMKRVSYCLPTENRSETRVRSLIRATRMIFLVVGAFAFCWLPIHIVFLLYSVSKIQIDDWFIWMQVVANCLSYGNSFLNPIIYSMVSTDFRRAMVNVITCNVNR